MDKRNDGASCDNVKCLRYGLLSVRAYPEETDDKDKENAVEKTSAKIMLIIWKTLTERLNIGKKTKPSPPSGEKNDWNKYTSNFNDELDN